MENRPTCDFCESIDKTVRIGTHKDREIEYTLYECGECGVQFWLPMKNPGAEWYERDERYSGINKDPEIVANWSHRKAIDYLFPIVGTVLDIGCGTGNFLYYAKSKGWKVSGFDFDRQAVAAATNVFNLPHIEMNDLAGYASDHRNETFDLITFFDVFEHIDNHNNFIGTIRSMLNPGGHIAMSMPYRKGAMWLKPNDLPPRHLTRWDRKSIREYLARHGFETVYMARRTEGVRHVLLKLRFRYGKLFSFGLVNKVKSAERKGGAIEIGSSAERKIGFAKKIARLKDWAIFGLPALLIWLAMLSTSKRYISLFVVAKKK